MKLPEQPEPLPVPTSAQHFISAAYETTGLRAHHLRDLIRVLDESGVPDDAAVYVYGTMNRTVQMVTFRVDIDTDDDPAAALNDMLS